MRYRYGLVFWVAVARAMQLSATAFAFTALGHVSTSMAQTSLKTITWGPAGSPYKLTDYDCVKERVATIFIEGTLELVHPDDKPDKVSAPTIVLRCDNFVFGKNSKIRSRAVLYITGNRSISGAVDIENTRGLDGKNAVVESHLYIRTKAAKGRDGGRGNTGGDALDTTVTYPAGRDAETGGEGGAGVRGTDGATGTKAPDGLPGAAAAGITLKAGTYGPGTTIVTTARGGDGGTGANGGPGQDGGDGGQGGEGGSGGNASWGRRAGDGGKGGAGGNGGNGGPGGFGGDGGDGGRGGDAHVFILTDGTGKQGSPPTAWNHRLEGGKGGVPGLGGPPGRGGNGAPGGMGGCGGTGSHVLNIGIHPAGSCAGQGARGKDGLWGGDAAPQPVGRFGRDGNSGVAGSWLIGYVVEKKKGN